MKFSVFFHNFYAFLYAIATAQTKLLTQFIKINLLFAENFVLRSLLISSIKLVLLLLCMTYVVSTAAVAVSCGKKLIHYFLIEEEETGSLKLFI